MVTVSIKTTKKSGGKEVPLEKIGQIYLQDIEGHTCMVLEETNGKIVSTRVMKAEVTITDGDGKPQKLTVPVFFD